MVTKTETRLEKLKSRVERKTLGQTIRNRRTTKTLL